jgi:hypothetical protein
MLRITQILDWKYVVTETVIVTIGVAMALSADAWWSDRSDRAAESLYLRGLQVEFSATAFDLEEEIKSSTESIVAIDELMDFMVSEAVEAPSQVLQNIETGFQTSILRPVTATYDDLVTSGNIGILRSDALRIALARWHAQLENHRRLEDHILAPLYLMTDEFMMQNVAVTEMFPANQAANAPFELNISGLLADRQMWNLLVIRRTWAANRRISLEELQKMLKRIQSALDAGV